MGVASLPSLGFHTLLLVSTCVFLFVSRASGVEEALRSFRRLGLYNASTEDGSGRSSEPNIAMSEYCGNWQNEYIQLHDSIKKKPIGDEQRRIIVYECNRIHGCGGLGDQIIGIMATFLIALISDRGFEINYPALSSVFTPASIDWTYNGELAGLSCQYLQFSQMFRSNYTKWASSIITDKRLVCINMNRANYHSYQMNFDPFMKFIQDYQTVILRANNGIFSFLIKYVKYRDRLKKRRLNRENPPGCFLHFLFRVNASVVESVKKIEQSLIAPKVFSVCIHIRPIRHRHTDDTLFTASNPGESLLKDVEFVLRCAEKVTKHFAKPEQDIKWFVMSSSPWLKTKISQIYPDRVIKTDVQPRHVGLVGEQLLADALQDTIKEWYLFSKCNKHVMISSGLSKTAVAYSFNYNSSFMFPHGIFFQYDTLNSSFLDGLCDVANPTSIWKMSMDWSRL